MPPITWSASPAELVQVAPGRHLEDDDRGRLGTSQQLALGRRDRDGPLFRRVSAARPKNPHWPDRDRFILSKGHAAPVLYAALAQAGYFPHEEIMTLRKLGSPLEGHPEHEASCAASRPRPARSARAVASASAMPWPPASTRRAITRMF